MSIEQNLPPFSYRLQVRFADTDLQGHVYCANYLTYMDETLVAYQGKLGYSWKRLEDLGFGIYYVDCGYQFKGQAFVEDDLHIYADIVKLGNSSLRVEMTIFRSDGQELVGTGFIAGVFVDAKTGNPTPIPQEFREAVTAYQGVVK